jgi:type 1 fimbria pilin
MMSCVSCAFAAGNTAELRVTGSITPSSCTPSFSAGGQINLGHITADSLNFNSSTKLPMQTTTLLIQCNAPTKVKVSIVDNRPNTAPLYFGEGSGQYFFGLGAVSNKNNVGGYRISPNTQEGSTGDSVKAAIIKSVDGGGTWVKTDYSSALGDGLQLSLMGSAVSPADYKVHKYSFYVEPFIDRSQLFDLRDKITLDGLATFEIEYI